jgi:hypothetical protein
MNLNTGSILVDKLQTIIFNMFAETLKRDIQDVKFPSATSFTFYVCNSNGIFQVPSD